MKKLYSFCQGKKLEQFRVNSKLLKRILKTYIHIHTRLNFFKRYCNVKDLTN